MALNWDAISAVSEILGAIAVVVTLIYLARQIRLNSQAVEVSALRDTTEQWNLWSQIMATSPELADVVARGNRSYRPLPEVEAMRYGAYVQMFFDCAESYRSLVSEHEVQKDIEVLEAIVGRRASIRGFCEWWEENRIDYSQDFVTWVDGVVERYDKSGENNE